MTSTRVFFSILLFSALVLFGLPFLRGDTQQVNNKSMTSEAMTEYETKVDEGAVVVTVTPKKLFSADGEIVFEVTLDTHNVPLDYDIRALSTLTDEKKNTYKVTSWTGGRGGHHLKGDLGFISVAPKVQELTLNISEIDAKKRIFRWKRGE